MKWGIKVIDDKTLEVTLEAPTPYFWWFSYVQIIYAVKPKILQRSKDKYFTDAEYTISNGPYTMESWTHDSELKFKKILLLGRI